MVLDKCWDHTIYTVDRTCHPGAARSARGTSMVPTGQQSVMRNMLKESNKIVQYLKKTHIRVMNVLGHLELDYVALMVIPSWAILVRYNGDEIEK